MKSLCRNCKGFGVCGFASFVPMTVHSCDDYARGTINHGKDVYIMGTPSSKQKTSKKKKKTSVSEDKVERRLKNILADFPSDFRANDLKVAYEKKHKEPLVFKAELRKKVCTPWKQGILINNCRVRRRNQHAVLC